MKIAIGRFASFLITAGSWVVLAFKLVLDIIGYSTVPEDAAVAQTRMEQFLGWLLTVPWWAVIGVVVVFTISLMWLSWPRNVGPCESSQPFIKKEKIEVDNVIYKEISASVPLIEGTVAYKDLDKRYPKAMFYFTIFNGTGKRIKIMSVTGCVAINGENFNGNIELLSENREIECNEFFEFTIQQNINQGDVEWIKGFMEESTYIIFQFKDARLRILTTEPSSQIEFYVEIPRELQFATKRGRASPAIYIQTNQSL
jgi:hypothetical protein